MNLKINGININVVWLIFSFCILICLLASIWLFRNENKLGLAFFLIPFILILLYNVFSNSVFGLILVIIANYYVMGIARYAPGPLGLTIDALLVLTWISLAFSQFNKSVDWKRLHNLPTYCAVIWFCYTLFQLFNPEAVSRVAWFYAMRGVSLYMLLTIPLCFLLFNQPKYLHLFLKLWSIFTVTAVLKGIQQHVLGPDPFEQHWLATIGGKTHLLPGGLRVFSFFTDAATYGGSMGYSGVVFGIIGLKMPNAKLKWWYLFVSAAAFYGMLISGTRGAIAVPFAGLTLYAVLSKNFKILFGGLLIVITAYSFLKFTTIGNSVYEIRRFRTGLNPDNPSLQVRLDNQKKLKTYLASRPFGGGIGTSGNWGLRFSPGTFLAEIPTDSWYVMIWAEQGRVGLYLHLSILFTIIARSSWLIMFQIKDKELANTAAALCAGMFGIMAASYGSGALGQMPNGVYVYISIAFIFMIAEWDNKKHLPLKNSKDHS